ncbi:MAG: hypothetical protein ACTSPY_10915 [Candidatus Helarchaeota archaeon]
MTKKAIIINKIKELLKDIKKNKVPEKTKVLLDLDEIYIAENEDAWQILGLSLKDLIKNKTSS